MNKTLTTLTAALIVALGSPMAPQAQETEPDPEVQKAKEETAVVYDLGRFFGYAATMEEENAKLALSRSQMESFYAVMSEIEKTTRIEPEWAEEKLEYLELDVLTPDQLLEVDQLALARESTRDSGGGTGQGGSTGSGPIMTYVAGGAFNPMLDETKSLGQGYYELYRSIAKRLGR